MTISPTQRGEVSLQPDSESDWSVLEMISVDIGRPGHLAESMSDLMDDDSEWDEWVVPDLKEVYETQNTYVAAAVQRAKKENERAIVITPKDVDFWYGAVNQARLSLQARYRLDEIEPRDEMDMVEDLPDKQRFAYLRDGFYSALLSYLLSFVMGESH